MILITILTFGILVCNSYKVEKPESKESHIQQVVYINPTGTYNLDNKTEKKNGQVYGYSGQIQVKKLSNDKIVLTFEVNKGAPSYNSGSFVDTLAYICNKALYSSPADIDSTCRITFRFAKKGITVAEETSDYNSGCGFGQGVVADGFYKKTSIKSTN